MTVQDASLHAVGESMMAVTSALNTALGAPRALPASAAGSNDAALVAALEDLLACIASGQFGFEAMGDAYASAQGRSAGDEASATRGGVLPLEALPNLFGRQRPCSFGLHVGRLLLCLVCCRRLGLVAQRRVAAGDWESVMEESLSILAFRRVLTFSITPPSATGGSAEGAVSEPLSLIDFLARLVWRLVACTPPDCIGGAGAGGGEGVPPRCVALLEAMEGYGLEEGYGGRLAEEVASATKEGGRAVASASPTDIRPPTPPPVVANAAGSIAGGGGGGCEFSFASVTQDALENATFTLGGTRFGGSNAALQSTFVTARSRKATMWPNGGGVGGGEPQKQVSPLSSITSLPASAVAAFRGGLVAPGLRGGGVVPVPAPSLPLYLQSRRAVAASSATVAGAAPHRPQSINGVGLGNGAAAAGGPGHQPASRVMGEGPPAKSAVTVHAAADFASSGCALQEGQVLQAAPDTGANARRGRKRQRSGSCPLDSLLATPQRDRSSAAVNVHMTPSRLPPATPPQFDISSPDVSTRMGPSTLLIPATPSPARQYGLADAHHRRGSYDGHYPSSVQPTRIDDSFLNAHSAGGGYYTTEDGGGYTMYVASMPATPNPTEKRNSAVPPSPY